MLQLFQHLWLKKKYLKIQYVNNDTYALEQYGEHIHIAMSAYVYGIFNGNVT